MRRLKLLELHDRMNVFFFAFLSVVSIVFVNEFPERALLPLFNIAIIVIAVYIVSEYESRYEDDFSAPPLFRFVRYWYPVFTILFCFKEVYVIMFSRGDKLMDELLINADRLLFGFDPTVELSGYSNPFATEFFQIIYGIFYLMPVIYASELYFWHRYEEFKYASFMIMFGFYLSFVGYLMVPAVGPRFTLHDFHSTDTELQGLWLTQIIRDIINFGESIPKNATDAIHVAQRDAFPSGHTIVITLITYLSWKIRSKSFMFYLPYSLLMIFSTVYLRYHYVIDLIAAIPFVLVTIGITNYFYSEKKKATVRSEVS